MKVTLLAHTSNPEKLVAGAAKLCYSGSDIETLLDGLTPENIDKFLDILMSNHHESPLEHISFTFGIEGVSRTLEQQLTRHRIASYSIQSGRYVRRNPQFAMPIDIDNNPKAKSIFETTTVICIKAYNDLIDELSSGYMMKGMSAQTAEKKALENARAILPNSLQTKIICTMNARSLLNFFKHRCCSRAQDEIRVLAYKMLTLVQQEAPTLFKNAGAACVSGPCPEGKLSCGVSRRRK